MTNGNGHLVDTERSRHRAAVVEVVTYELKHCAPRVVGANELGVEHDLETGIP